MACDGSIEVGDNGGWNDGGRPGGKSDDTPAFPQHQMPAAVGVKVAKRGDGAEAEWKVGGVGVLETHGTWAKVERCGCEDAADEITLEGGVVGKQAANSVNVVCIMLCEPRSKDV